MTSPSLPVRSSGRADASRRATFTVLVLPLLAVLLMSCTPEGRDSDSSAPGSATPSSPTATPKPAPTTTPGTVEWTVKGAPAGRHLLIDGAVVGYIVRGRHLYLRALDATDGSLLWEKAASPGWNPPGVPTSVTTIGTWVVYLAPYGADYEDHYQTRVVVAEARTGSAVSATSEYSTVQGFPEQCGQLICYSEADGDRLKQLSLNPSTGAVKSIARFSGREIGSHGLVELRTDQGATPRLGRIVDGEVAWEVPFSDVFAPRFMPDGGWQWSYDKAEKLFIGEVGYFDLEQTSSDPYRESMMVGIDAASGKVRWRELGSTQWCPQVRAATMELDEGDDSADHGFRCRYAKGSRIDWGKKKSTFHHVRVSLERFDHASGKTRWSVPVQVLNGHISESSMTALRVDDDHVMITRKDGPVQVDLRSGALTPFPAGTQLWCSRTVEKPYLPFYHDRDSDRYTGTVQFPCTAKQKPTKINRTIPSFVGEHGDGLVFVSQKESVVAYRQ